jgi:putative flippase GtrA
MKAEEIKKYVIYAIGGGAGTLLCIFLTYVMTEFFNFWYLFSYITAGFVAIVFNFLFHFFITFGSRSEMKKRFFKFVIMSVVVGIITPSLIYVLTDVLKVWYIASGIIAIVGMSLVTFVINKSWIFQKDANQ